jgi:hypothetical protein
MSRIANNHLLVVTLLLAMADNAVMVRFALGPVLGIQSSALVFVLAWVWFALIAATVAVLLRRPSRAIFLIVILGLFSTVALSISLVPFVLELVPVNLRPYAMTIGNASFLVLSAFLLRRGGETRRRLAAG